MIVNKFFTLEIIKNNFVMISQNNRRNPGKIVSFFPLNQGVENLLRFQRKLVKTKAFEPPCAEKD
jgi:hypothetical protein